MGGIKHESTEEGVNGLLLAKQVRRQALLPGGWGREVGGGGGSGS